MGKPSTKAQNKYIAKAYDRINLTVSKGKKEVIQSHAQAQGKSVNGFINEAIDEKMQRDNEKGLRRYSAVCRSSHHCKYRCAPSATPVRPAAHL